MTSPLRERILQTASELFYRQGIRATGVDAIVKAAGTTKMSLYHYFPSKNDLVLAHLEKSAETMRALLQAGIEARATAPKERLLAVFDVFTELLASEGFRGCPFINAAAESADGEDPLTCAAADFYNDFRVSLSELAAAAGARQPDTLARQLQILLSGAIIIEQMRRDSGAIAAARQAAEVLIEQGVCA